MAIAAVLSGAESWNDMAEYGKSKREWLKTFLTLPFGIPSHDTFNRVFTALDPEEMEKGIRRLGFVDCQLTAGEVVAIDGKTLCGTRETGKKKLVHMVSAWAEGNGPVLGQRKVDEKSNEITAIPKLLNALELAGAVVTIDAMGCQREIASRIIEKKADYVLAVKDNQGLLAEQVRDSFLLLNADAVAEEVDCGHGRVEQRRCSLIVDLSMIEKASEWASIQGLVRIGVGTIPQGHGQNREGNPLLHHQSQAGCDATQCGNPPALGHRKQIALGARCGLRRGSGSQARRTLGTKLLADQPHRPQPAQTGAIVKTRNQGKTTQSRMGPHLSAQITGKLICVAPDRMPGT